MSEDIKPERMVAHLKYLMRGMAGAEFIDEADYDPAVRKLVKDEHITKQDDGTSLFTIHRRPGKVLVWQALPPEEDINKLADLLLEKKLSDKKFLLDACAMAMSNDYEHAEFMVKCYSYGQNIVDNNTINYLGKTTPGHDFRLWMREYVTIVSRIFLDNYDDVTSTKKGLPAVNVQEKLEAEMLRMNDISANVSAPEKYSRVVAFNYIAEGLRKEGYNVKPMDMPKHLTDMVQRRAMADFYGRQV